MSPRFAVKLNALALYAIGLVLLAAFYFQIALSEIPCPLCMLQRVSLRRAGGRTGADAAAWTAAEPLRDNASSRRSSGAGIAARQVLLHIAPGDPGYGSALFGYHFYTWAFVCFAAAILASAVVFLSEAQFASRTSAPQLGLFETAAIWLVLARDRPQRGERLLECGFACVPGQSRPLSALRAV